MIEKYHITEGVKIHLEKHILIAAGMAGCCSHPEGNEPPV